MWKIKSRIIFIYCIPFESQFNVEQKLTNKFCLKILCFWVLASFVTDLVDLWCPPVTSGDLQGLGQGPLVITGTSMSMHIQNHLWRNYSKIPISKFQLILWLIHLNKFDLDSEKLSWQRSFIRFIKAEYKSNNVFKYNNRFIKKYLIHKVEIS